MIITNVIGGLGNQMFQYAFGRALSLRHGVPLKLDVHEFYGYNRHGGFLLKKLFGLSAETASAADRRDVLGWRGHLAMLKLLRRRGFEHWRGRNLLVQDLGEPASRYVATAGENCYLLGYWQSERYFADAADQVRRDFRFLPAPSRESAGWARRIQGCTAVSVHVRRGDYASDPQTLATHGLCSLEYYHRAVAYIAERVASAEFFLFSDDLPWVRRSLAISHPHHFVDCNSGETSFQDMRLISLCRHHIVANSSFSWWGAWLCDHAQKIIVAPMRWLAQVPMPEVVPQSWVRI